MIKKKLSVTPCPVTPCPPKGVIEKLIVLHECKCREEWRIFVLKCLKLNKVEITSKQPNKVCKKVSQRKQRTAKFAKMHGLLCVIVALFENFKKGEKRYYVQGCDANEV
jgi:hypothetical protein